MRRHPFDPLSAALGILAIALGALVATAELDQQGSDTGAWITAAVLVVGLGLLPWSRRRSRTSEEVAAAAAERADDGSV